MNNIGFSLKAEYQGKIVTNSTLNRSENFIANFLKSAEKYSNETAICGDRELTYSEFLDEVKRTAAVFSKAGIKSGDMIGVYCHHTVKTIVCIYAVMYLGAVYVPIGSDYPEERIRNIIEKSKIRFIVNAESMDMYVSVEKIISNDTRFVESVIPKPYSGTEGYAYCMFTSGTTGKPKGVLIKQNYLLNMCEWYGETFKINTDSRLILLNNFGFDGSLKTIFASLLYGGCIILASDTLFDIRVNAEKISRYKVTHLACVPSLMQGIAEYCAERNFKDLKTVKYFISAGEKFRSKELLKWLDSENCNAEFINLYGPAECSCCVSYHFVSTKELHENIVPIGKPIYNKRVYILNENLEECTFGEEGNIWIAGLGTFEGYIGMNAEESNLHKDIENEKELMYLSGDRGKRLENGDILYCGRKDNQLKISGQRIEIEEIEQALLKYSGIRSCGLCIRNESEKSIMTMFYTSEKNTEYSFEELSEFMSRSIVRGVIPNKFIRIDKMPVNVNGKLDRNALLSISIPSEKAESRNDENDEITKKVLQAWKNTLETDDIPIDTGFFELGGYSMLLYSLQGEIKDILGKEITPAEILAHPTVRSMSDFFKGNKSSSETLERPRRVRRIRRLKS